METRERIRKFIIDTFLFGKESSLLNDAKSFLESGIIDSTGILELVGFIEDEFSLEVADEELVPENFDSVDKLAVYIRSKQ